MLGGGGDLEEVLDEVSGLIVSLVYDGLDEHGVVGKMYSRRYPMLRTNSSKTVYKYYHYGSTTVNEIHERAAWAAKRNAQLCCILLSAPQQPLSLVVNKHLRILQPLPIMI